MFIAPKLPSWLLAPVGAKCIPSEISPLRGEEDRFCCVVYKHLAPLGRKHSASLGQSYQWLRQKEHTFT